MTNHLGIHNKFPNAENHNCFVFLFLNMDTISDSPHDNGLQSSSQIPRIRIVSDFVGLSPLSLKQSLRNLVCTGRFFRFSSQMLNSTSTLVEESSDTFPEFAVVTFEALKLGLGH